MVAKADIAAFDPTYPIFVDTLSAVHQVPANICLYSRGRESKSNKHAAVYLWYFGGRRMGISMASASNRAATGITAY